MEIQMIQLNNTFAIGCLVQWYEIDIVDEYIESLKDAINYIDDTRYGKGIISTHNQESIEALCLKEIEQLKTKSFLNPNFQNNKPRARGWMEG